MPHKSERSLTARKGAALKGVADVPGDKSVSHRALIFGALSVGETRITGLLEGEDVLATAQAMRAFGADMVRDDDGWSVHGVGVGGLGEPEDVIDCGNAGTVHFCLPEFHQPFRWREPGHPGYAVNPQFAPDYGTCRHSEH